MKRYMKRLREQVERYWVGTLLLCGTVAVISLPLLYRLGHLTGGLSASEMALRLQVSMHQISLASLLHDPFFLPYKLGLYILQLIPLNGGASLRIISAFIGLMGIIGFYYVVRTWHTRRLAVMATILFACSSWLLHVARYASIDSLYLYLFVVLASWVWVKRGTYRRLAFITALVVTIFGLYLPGFIWFIVPAIIWQRKTLIKTFRKIPLYITVPAAVITGLLLSPLVIACIAPSDHATMAGNIKEFFGLPNVFPSITQALKNLASIPMQIFVLSPANSLLSVGRLPLIDIFTGAMVLVGLVNLATNYKLDRAKIIFVILSVGSVLTALGGPVHISLLLPFIYLLAAEGIGYLLCEWLRVFPRNPFARVLGLGIVSIAIAASCWFQLTSYFIAWPHTDIVKSSFTHHP